MNITLYADGGCKNNGATNAAAYGSFAVVKDGKVQRNEHLDLPEVKTNNVAEYCALHAALEYLDELARRVNTKGMDITVQMDSTLVINQVNGAWKAKDAELKALCAYASALLDELAKQYASVNLSHCPRDEVVRFLGH